MPDTARLRDVNVTLTRIAEDGARESRWLPERRDRLAEPETCAEASPADRQYLLCCDLPGRLPVVSFVWNPGQRTPVRNHTAWELVGPLRPGRADRLRPRQVVAVCPALWDRSGARAA